MNAQHRAELDLFAHFATHAFHTDGVAGSDTILLPPGLDYGVHHSSRAKDKPQLYGFERIIVNAWFRAIFTVSVLKRGRIVAQQGAAHDGYGRIALAHEVIMEFAEREARALFFAQVFAQPHDLQLTQRVVEIGWVGGTTLGFNLGDFRRLIAFLDEKRACLFERESPPVHLDADNKARVAQQRILQLAETDQPRFPHVLRADSRLRVAFVEHHLLGVVGPAFHIGAGGKYLAQLRRRTVFPKILREVARKRFVN